MFSGTVTLPGYICDALLYEGQRSRIFRGSRRSDGKAVAIKVFWANESAEELAQREYDLAVRCAGDDIVAALAFEHAGDEPAVVFAYVGAKSLRDEVTPDGFPIPMFLERALALARAVASIHHARVVHRDLKPENTLVDETTGQLRITDFGIAVALAKGQDAVDEEGVLQGSLAYVAPEQTGRMNRKVDTRADLYSLGIIFYELLTGFVPFQSTDALELVHAHLTQIPRPIHEVRPQVPRLLSDLVARLVAKEPSERYQTARGLFYDLERCAVAMRQGEELSFPLGERDIPERLTLAERLVGRAEVGEAISAAWKRAQQGNVELLLLSGPVGSGKSAHLLTSRPHPSETTARFALGCFEAHRRNEPYSAIRDALTAVVMDLFTESEADLASWKAALTGALGAIGQVVVDLVPDLETVMGEQAPLDELGPTEAKRRFVLGIRRLMQVLATKHHPLVIALDDLHEADRASLGLLQSVVTEAEQCALLVVGTAREDDLAADHPLRELLKACQEAKRAARVEILPLTDGDLAELLGVTLRVPSTQVERLAAILGQKTGRNPLFLRQLVDRLAEQRVFHLGDDGRWAWDEVAVQTAPVPDSVAGVMSAKLDGLTADALSVLRRASTIGPRFEPAVLHAIAGQPAEQVEKNLEELVGNGLLGKSRREYVFAHPSLYESARAGLEPSEAKALKFKVGWLLLERAGTASKGSATWRASVTLLSGAGKAALAKSGAGKAALVKSAVGKAAPATGTPREVDGAELGDSVFVIVEHLNEGIDGELSAKERDRIVRLNAVAGARALAAASYESALVFLSAGFLLVDDDLRQRQFPLCYTLALSRARALYLCGRTEEGSAAFDALLEWPVSISQLAEVVASRVTLVTTTDQKAAVEVGLAGLARCGEHFTFKPSPLGLVAALVQVIVLLKRRSDQQLSGSSPAEDERSRALSLIFNATGPAAYFANPKLFLRIHLANMLVNLRKGYAPTVAYAFARHALITVGVLKNFPMAIRLVRVTERLHERFPDPRFWPRTQALLNLFIKAWTEPARGIAVSLDGLWRACEEAGDAEYANYAMHTRNNLMWVMGTPLRAMVPVVEEAVRTSKRLGFEPVAAMEHSTLRVIRCLAGQEPLDESDPIGLSETAAFDTKAVRYNAITRGLVFLYLFDRHAEAFKLAEETSDAAKVLMAQPTVTEHHFFHGMAAARVAAEGGPDASKAKSRLKQLVKIFRKLVVHCRDNNQHRLELLEAELARLEGHHTQTFMHYGKAAAHAHQFEILHMEALAHERRSSLLKEMGLDGESALFALQAFEGYRAWGAHGKTKRMEEAMPKLTELRATVRSTTRSATTDIPLSRTAHATANSEPSSRGSSASSSLDVKTLLSVSQAVSEELAVDAVMRKVLEGALGHAGADRGLILLRRNGVLLVEAEALQGGSFTCPSLPVKGYTGLADTVLRPVERSGERLVIDDASTDSRTAADPHIVKSGVRSVLCMPLVRQGAPVGLLYLENHEAAAFTPDALEILRVLSTQAAISLDNALLYANLEARVTARTNELKDRSRAMRLVLDRVEQGLITLGPSGLVSEERSAIVDRWFGPCPANTIFGDYLRPHAPDTGAMFTLGWEAVTDGFLPMELCIEQLPKRMVVGDRHFEFAYRPIVSESEQLLNCLVVMTDVTSEVDRERMEGEQRETMQLFERIARDRAGVVEFAAEARRMVQVISGRALDDLAEMKRVVHTLKGNSGIFGLHQIASVCQEIEAEMEEMEAMPSALMRVALADRWNAVDAKLGLWLGDQSSRLVEVQDEEYRSVLRALRLSEPRAEVVGQMDAWSLEPMEKRLRRIGDQVERLAERLGKAPIRLIIEPNRLRLDPEHWGTFWGSLVHVVRNAVDHGLETAEERSAAGKREPGTITLRTVRAGDELRIEIADNGKGIHWDAIAAKALKSGLPSATHEERVRALFSDGISTRDEVTEISGRGVGTSVVLRECEARGGHIEVRSEAGKGTCFSFCFPAVEALRRTRTVPMHPEDIPKLHLPPRLPHIPLPLDGGN